MIVKFGTHLQRYHAALEEQTGRRCDFGYVPCQYCGEVDCDFDCDESQANGYPEGD